MFISLFLNIWRSKDMVQNGLGEGIPKRPFLHRALIIYSVLIALWLLLRLLFKDSLWWLALINSYVLWLFLPIPVLLMAGWLSRQVKRPLLLLLFPIGVFIWLYGALFWPNSLQEGGENGRTLTAMSYNILFTNQNVEAITDVILAAKADIVALQEVTRQHSAGLNTRLIETYPYQIIPPPVSQNTNVALFSKYPIEQLFEFDFPPRHMGIHALIDLDGQPIHVFAAHLLPNGLLNLDNQSIAAQARQRYTLRMVEVTNLQLEMSTISDPILFLCDCNLTETSQAYARLDSFLQDSFREVGWGFGFTAFVPTTGVPPANRIDYVWHSGELTAVSTHVGERGESDHFPIIATLQLTE
jgi:vancomycin resistance protein VanJ